MNLDSPFPYFGGKRKIAANVWARFGSVNNYVEPFFGSGAVLFRRPKVEGIETINDLDGFVSNAWRAIKLHPEKTAEHADHPVNETDLHARHSWLVTQTPSLAPRLEGDPDWCDPKMAGWWVWGMSCWIGSGFCSGSGPWTVVDGQLIHLGNAGRGVKRQLIHLGDAGRGVNRLLPWFTALSDRLRNVRVCSGTWGRVCGPSVTFKHGMTAVFLDPPYSDINNRDNDLYRMDSSSVSHSVCEWAIENGKRADMRIALCGYEGEHDMPPDWSVEHWNAGHGYGGQAHDRSLNGKRESIWYSPACVAPAQQSLFAAEKGRIHDGPR